MAKEPTRSLGKQTARPAPGFPLGIQDASAGATRPRTAVAGIVARLTDKGTLDSLTFKQQVAISELVATGGSVETLLSLLHEYGVAVREVAAAVATTSGGQAAFDASPYAGDVVGNVFAGTRLDNVQLTDEAGNLFGTGWINYGGAGETGLAQTSITKEQGAAHNPPISEGDVVTVGFQSQSGQSGQGISVRVYFSDSDSTTVTEAAQQAGIVSPEGDPSGFLAFVDTASLTLDTTYLGVKNGTPVRTTDPQGRERLVSPVFEYNDPEAFYWSLSPEARRDYEIDMRKAGIVVDGASIDEWVRGMTMVMSNANAQGLVNASDPVGRQWGLARSISQLAERPRPIPAFVAQTRRTTDPAEMEQSIQDYARERTGRDLQPWEIDEFVDYLTTSYDMAFDQEDLAAKRQHIQDAVANGALPNQDEQRLLNEGDVVMVNPQARLQEYFDKEMSGAIGFQERRGQAQRTRATLMDTLTMAQGMSR